VGPGAVNADEIGGARLADVVGGSMLGGVPAHLATHHGPGVVGDAVLRGNIISSSGGVHRVRDTSTKVVRVHIPQSLVVEVISRVLGRQPDHVEQNNISRPSGSRRGS